VTPVLEVSQISKSYGAAPGTAPVLDHIDFTVEDNEVVCVVGPTGCGKTTLLKCTAGLIKPSAGEARLRGVAVTSPPADMAVVFQDYSRSLFAWLTVRKNVALPIEGKRAIADKRAAVEESLTAVGLAHVGHCYPWQLSGGMQQRVAIARALAYQPKVLLMDEPFASVDAQTRAELEDLVLSVRSRFGITILLVTHDIDEATYMADRVIVLSRSPARVREILPVRLPWPRDQLATKEMAEFIRTRSQVYRAIRDTAGGSGGPSSGAVTAEGPGGSSQSHPAGTDISPAAHYQP
jgi:NitT/TauT family transport system ATP-binding protein